MTQAIEVFERVIASLRDLASTDDLRAGTTHYHGIVREWVADMARCYAAELAHKRLCLAAVDKPALLRRWHDEPFVNATLKADILRLTGASGDDD